MTTPRRWKIEPNTLHVVPVDGGPVGRFTGQDWQAQQWPACPVCQTTIAVGQVDVTESGDYYPMYAMGAWRCPNDCDPRPVLRP
jgi:hypothetical protein